MNNVQVGDLVWVPDKTCAWDAAQVVEICGPTLGLVKDPSNPLRILVRTDDGQDELSVFKKDVYDIGDFYD